MARRPAGPGHPGRLLGQRAAARRAHQQPHPASREEILGALRTYKGAVILVTHDEGAVEALEPERIILLPDGVEDLWGPDYRDLVALA